MCLDHVFNSIFDTFDENYSDKDEADEGDNGDYTTKMKWMTKIIMKKKNKFGSALNHLIVINLC